MSPQEVNNQQSSSYSSQDSDGVLMTDKVEEKLLTTLAYLKSKDPSIYQEKNKIFEDLDFQPYQKPSKQPLKTKYTYKSMLQKAMVQDSSSEESEAPIVSQSKAKLNLKQALSKTLPKDDFMTVQSQNDKKSISQEEKLRNLTEHFTEEGKKVVSQYWENEAELDRTDLFLKRYILDKKWISSKYEADQKQQDIIDQEDQRRDQEIRAYEAKYNFRFQEPGSEKIISYPRTVQESIRILPNSRKEKRKKRQQRLRQRQQALRTEALKNQEGLRQQILCKLNENQTTQQISHDWFFCDDCTKPLQELEIVYFCQICEDYMLCEECFQLITHAHKMISGQIPSGNGPPDNDQARAITQRLKNCKICHRKIPDNITHFEAIDKQKTFSYLCMACFDQSGLQMQKKYKKVQSEVQDYAKLLENAPEKIKELANSQQIQQMVDEYISCNFESTIGGQLRTKFKYIQVQPEGFGLSDEQILYGSDKEMNRYVSVKKLAPYTDKRLRLRNSIYRKKIQNITDSVRQNLKMVKKEGEHCLLKMRTLQKVQRRAELLKRRRQRLKIINLSDPNNQKKYNISNNRLISYGLSQLQ